MTRIQRSLPTRRLRCGLRKSMKRWQEKRMPPAPAIALALLAFSLFVMAARQARRP